MKPREYQNAEKVNVLSEDHLTHAEAIYHQRLGGLNTSLGEDILNELELLSGDQGEHAPRVIRKKSDSQDSSKERAITEERLGLIGAMKGQLAFALSQNRALFEDRFRAFLADDDTPPLTFDRLKRIKLTPDTIVDQSFRDLYAFLQWNRRAVHKETEAFHSGIEKSVRETFRLYMKGIQRGIVLRPEAKVKNLLSKLTYGVQDALLSPHLMKGSFYEADSHALWFSSHMSGEDIRMEYIKGTMHALAGKTLLSVPQGMEGFPNVIALRNGLYFGNSYHPYMAHDVIQKKRFEWLDEAVTTDLLMQLLGQRQEPQNPENKIVSLLCRKSGISKQLLYKAYFEDYDTTIPQKDRLTAWRAVMRSFTAAFGQGYLVAIDNQIQQKGSAAVLTDLERWDEE